MPASRQRPQYCTVRMAHDARREAETWRQARAARWPSSLVPRPSFLGPSVPRQPSVPRSLGLSFHATRRWSPRSACARHKTTREVSDANGGGARDAAAFTPAAPSRGAARGMRRVCSSDGRAGSRPGESTPGRREAPSPPPGPPARHTQQSRLQIVASAASRAARGRAASCVLPKPPAQAMNMRAPRRRSSSHPVPAFTKPPTQPFSTTPLQQRRSRVDAASVRVLSRLPPGAPRRKPPGIRRTTPEGMASAVRLEGGVKPASPKS